MKEKLTTLTFRVRDMLIDLLSSEGDSWMTIF